MKRSILITAIFLVPFFVSAQNIGLRTLHFNDTARKRPLVTEIWYPTTDTIQKHDNGFAPFVRVETVKGGSIAHRKFPLILISHGTGGGRLTLEWMADILVKNGFMVAAVDHWGNTYDNKIAIDFVTPWERPQDISFVLTGLLKDPVFGPEIDQSRIGAVGFSIGGYTVLALAGGRLDFEALKNYTNTSRIKAFFAICPAIGQGFVNKSQFKELDNPVYIIGAQADSMAPCKTNALNYHQLITGSQYYMVKGRVGHYVFLNEAAEPVKKQSPIYFTDDPSVDRHQVHQQVGEMAAGFFKEKLK